MGLDFRLHCPGAHEVTLLGPASNTSLTGFPLVEAQRLGRKPLAAYGGMAIFEVVQVPHPPASRPIETDWYWFEQLRDRQPMTTIAHTFRTRAGQAVMVYRLKPFDSQWRNYRVLRNGNPVIPAVSSYNADIYISNASADDWRVEFETDAPQWVDVHVF
jgi:hypothetical protein